MNEEIRSALRRVDDLLIKLIEKHEIKKYNILKEEMENRGLYSLSYSEPERFRIDMSPTREDYYLDGAWLFGIGKDEKKEPIKLFIPPYHS